MTGRLCARALEVSILRAGGDGRCCPGSVGRRGRCRDLPPSALGRMHGAGGLRVPAGVVTATDVIECDQSAISAPVMVFHEEPETVGTTLFLSGAEGIRTPGPLTPRYRSIPENPYAIRVLGPRLCYTARGVRD